VRFLGHQLYGEWLVILSLTSYMALANLGMGQTVGNRIAEAVASGRRREVPALVSTAFFAYAAIAILLLTVLLGFWPRLAGNHLRASGMVASAFAIYMGSALLSFPFKVHQMVLRAYNRVDRESAIEAGAATSRIVLIIPVLILGFKLVGVAIVNGATILAASVIGYVQAVKMDSAARPHLSLSSRRVLRAMAKPSVAFLAIQVGLTLITGIDNLVIGWVLGGEAVTRYAVPLRLITTASAMFSVAMNALTPAVTSVYATNQHDLLTRGFMILMRLGLMYATVGAIFLWFAGPAFIRFWAGPDVMPDRLTYGLQIVFFVLSVLVSIPATILWATTRHYRWAVMTIVEGLLNLALSLWGVHRYGLAGVIGGTVAASIVTNAWYIPAATASVLGISRREAARGLLPGVGLAATALAAAFAISTCDTMATATIAAATATLFALAYGRIAFTRDERARFAGWVSGYIRAAA
jgi:O-antigen/teichoic acid export membrane protein